MTVQLNHTIVHARDQRESAEFLSRTLGLGAPARFGPFLEVAVANGVNLDFDEVDDGQITAQHYAFLVSEDEFDEIVARLDASGVTHFADPAGHKPDDINHHDGGRGTYFSDPSGHWLEIITRPYGGG